MSSKEYVFTYAITTSPLFGQALEIEVAPSHTCPFNCIHCPHGKMKHSAVEPVEYFPPPSLVNGLGKLSLGSTNFSSIVLYGKGEPLLFSGMKMLIEALHEAFHVPIAIASCGTLLWNHQVRDAISNADIVLVSLAASDATTFKCVNRPRNAISFACFLEGLIAFSKSFKGNLWLRVYLLDGITAIEAEVMKMASIIEKINPRRIFLQTSCSSPPEDFAFPIDKGRLSGFRHFFGDKATVLNTD